MIESKLFPRHKRPEFPHHWHQLCKQAAVSAARAIDIHKSAKESKMPQWFVQRTAKARYMRCARYRRLKRRVDAMDARITKNLLHELGLATNE